jgi:hypothetical protein
MKKTIMILALAMTALVSKSQLNAQNTNALVIGNNEPGAGTNETDGDSITSILHERISESALIDLYPQRPFYNRSLKFNSGMSVRTYAISNMMQQYSDTSEHQFQVNGHSPIFSFSQGFAIDSTFSISYTLGYSQSDILFDNSYYGTKRYSLAVHPQVNLFRSYNWEYYMQLNVGLIYYDNNLDEVPSEVLQRIFPTGLKMFTGVTVVGINYFLGDHLAMNTELSIWGPETLNFGLSYRFFKAPTHKNQSPKYDFGMESPQSFNRR